MSTASKAFISDQVLYRLAGGYYDKNFPVQPEDVWAALNNLLNAKFKIEQLSVNMAMGETLPDGLMLGYYEDIEVTSLPNNRSKATLPIMPVSLPRAMGIYEITDKDNLTSFIPLLASQRMLLKSQPLISDLMGQVSYEVKGLTVYFSKDLKLLGNSVVNMTLVIMDISSYGADDTLPIPADMISDIINQLVAQFSAVVPENGIVNNYQPSNQQPIGK